MSQVLGTTSHQFQLFFDSSIDPTTGLTACDALAQNVFTDYEVLSSWFGGIELDHFDIHVDPPGTHHGALHFDCGARDIHIDLGSPDFDRMLVASEETEVFSANFDGDWDCGNSCGEALSRALAEELYPGNANGSPATVWLNGPRDNWIQQNDETDLNFDSTGCALLFLNWLRYQIGYRWEQIVGAGRQITDLNPEKLYHALTNASDGNGWKTFQSFIDAQFPVGTKVSLSGNNPFPIITGQKWSSWENRGAPPPGLASNFAPAVSSRAANHLEVVAVGSDNAAWVLLWNGNAWLPWTNAHGTLTAGPGAVSVNTGGTKLFARATDGTLYLADAEAFPLPNIGAWQPLGGSAFNGGPAVASWAPYRIDAFGISSGGLMHRFSRDYGKTFSAWETLGQPAAGLQLQGTPAVASRGPRKVDVFAAASDGTVWGGGWDSSGWAPWAKLALPGGPWASLNTIGLSSWWLNRYDMFLVDKSGGIRQLISTDSGRTWGLGTHFGPPSGTSISSGPAAISWGPNRIDIFVIGADKNLWHLWWG